MATFRLAFVYLIVGATFSLQATDLLRVATMPFPPWVNPESIREKVGPGYLIDLYEKVFKNLSIPFQIIDLPLKRLRLNLKSGKIHLFGCTRKTSDFPLVYGNAPWLMFKPALYQRSRLPKLTDVQKLKGQKILTGFGIIAPKEVLPPENEFISVPLSSIMHMFTKSRADYFVDYPARMETFIRQSDSFPTYRTYNLQAIEIFLCINKAVPDAEKLHHKIYQESLRFAYSAEGIKLAKKYGISEISWGHEQLHQKLTPTP